MREGSNYFNLGGYSRPIATQSTDAQLWFDRGLLWTYAYNQQEAAECFKKAAACDPKCTLAYWGIGYVIGPNYNKWWQYFNNQEKENAISIAQDAITTAKIHLNDATSLESELIDALANRYPDDASIEDYSPWIDNYANKMREVYNQFPHDLDVITLFVEALMTRTPWKLWDIQSGQPAANADTLEAMQVLETAFKELVHLGSNTHPGLLHTYIHLMEMSPFPEKSMKAANTLADLVPDAGHLVHMPSHIDVLCGEYGNVVHRNHQAITADKAYFKRNPAINDNTLSMVHNYHFKIYGAMFLGQKKTAMETAEELCEQLSEDVLEIMPDWLEPFVSIKQHVMIRFGLWDEVINQPIPANTELYSTTIAMIYYAKSIAYAVTENILEAENTRNKFRLAKEKVPSAKILFVNTCAEILEVASAMLDGELEYRKGNYDDAFEQLRHSIFLYDHLPYDEPWGWMQPTRHALGALLLEQSHVEEAEKIYRADLGFDDTLPRPCQHPNNVWSLHGMHECLVRMGRNKEANKLKPTLDAALDKADVPIKSSCFCRLSH